MTEKKAEKCLLGGVAAGVIGCQLQRMHQMAHYQDSIMPGDLRTPIQEAQKFLKQFRKAIRGARPEISAIESKLKQWGKQVNTFIPGPLNEDGIKILKADVKEMKRNLNKAVQQGLWSCGRPRATESDGADALQDYTHYLKEQEPGVSGRRR